MNKTTNKILIINGPNLNMFGLRKPEIYGTKTLADIEKLCRQTAENLGLSIDFRQSNYEGEIVTWIQEERTSIDALIINAAAYTHTSIAIHDALEILDVPIMEVHMSDPSKREEFRHISYVEPLATKTIKGKKEQGYVEAIREIAEILNNK